MIADETAEAVYSSFGAIAGKMPGGWSRRVDHSLIYVTGLPVPTLNGAITYSTDLESASGMLDEVAALGLPHCLQFPVGTTGLASFAAELGLHHEADVPLMRLEAAPIDVGRSGVAVRRVIASEAMLHAEVAARGFEAPVDVFAPMVTASASAPDVAIYVAEVDGEVVATGLGVLQGESVGVCNIATPPEFRKHGYGAAVTATIVNEAVRDGARWAWLQSSPDGYNLYFRLGFRTVSTWECWVQS